jgi:hypothetical protein
MRANGSRLRVAARLEIPRASGRTVDAMLEEESMRNRALVGLVVILMAIAACTNTGATQSPSASAQPSSPPASEEPSGSAPASAEPSGGTVDPTTLKIGMVTDVGQLGTSRSTSSPGRASRKVRRPSARRIRR